MCMCECVCVCVCVCTFHSAVHTCFIFQVSVVRVCTSLNIAGVEESLCCRLKSTGGREGYCNILILSLC